MTVYTDSQTQVPETGFWPPVNGRVGGALYAQLDHFVHLIRHNEGETITSIFDAVHGIEIAETIQRSVLEQREIVLEG